MKYIYLKFFKRQKAQKVANLIDKRLKLQGLKKEDIKNERKLYFDKIVKIAYKMNFNNNLVRVIAENIKSYSEFAEKINYVLEALDMDLNEYLDANKLIKLTFNGIDIELYLKIVRDFKFYKLKENEQGDIDKLMDFVKIPITDKLKITEIMVYTKNANCPLSQKKIVKYYDSYRPFTEDLESLKDAWILAYEKLEVKHNFKITIEDLIQTAKYNHNSKTFVNNLSRILDNEIIIPYEKFKILDLDDKKITDLVTLLIKTKFAGIIIDFEMVYNDMKVLDVWEILRYIVRFKDANFKLDYLQLRNYFFYSKDLEKLLRAFIYNNQKNIFEDYQKLYSSVIEIMSVKPQNVNVDPLLYLVAVEKAIKMNIFNIANEQTKQQNIEQVKQDYIAGHDVYTNLSMIELLSNYNINLSYTLSKFIEKSFGNDENRIQEFKKVIMSAVQPILFEGETFFVTTKDHIEIKANIIIEAVANLNNYFNGSDEKKLMQRANTILIDEIQRKYNHDEIIINIDKIANNVLFRLLEETPTPTTEYYSHKFMHKVNQHGHIEENEHNTDEHNKTQKKEHIEDEKKEFINEKEDKLIKVSKYIPRKVIIPKIEFIKETFKEFEKEKENYEIHKHHLEVEIDKLKAEIELKKAWAKSENLKYLILKDDETPKSEH